MSRDLPYFKFFTGEWLNGDITLESIEMQGLFINVCAYYWHKDCEVRFEQLKKKFKENVVLLNDLYPWFIHINEETDMVTIDFLDEQFAEFTVRKKKLSDAGKKGAINKKLKGQMKPPLNYPSTTREEKEKDKNKIKTIEDRKIAFKISLAKHLDKYDKDMMNDFFLYWTEHGDDDKKMRYEKQTSFSIERRLGTWKKNEKTFKDGHKTTAKNNSARTTQAGRQSFD